ncbi:MAG: type I phosphomannose isomerase catalytic subunit [Ethanoligenens sp.]
MQCYPMKMIPAFKDYIWGGNLLTTRFHKPSPYARTAESWELSCHPAGTSHIGNGEYQGMPLDEYVRRAGKAALGIHCERFVDFPVLIKLIDANDDLSVQVHPDDAYALKHEKEYGKTEMWYIVDCAAEASIIYGFQKDISKEEFRKSVENNTLLNVLNKVPVKQGDAFMIQSGTIHAIGKGCLIAEIQQSSNITYRVYDYGRVGADGKPRELHVEKAMDVTVLHPIVNTAGGQSTQADGYSRRRLAACSYFIVDLLDVTVSARLNATAESFHALTCTDGELVLHNGTDTLPMAAGDTVFLPAGCGEYILNGCGHLLLTSL